MKPLLVLTLGVVLCCIEFDAKCQQDSTLRGIHFQNDLSWSQILTQAKKEGKMIFVDCYTTWCGPCKVMERNVYPLEKVGRFFNAHFIAIKVQMDQTNKDDIATKRWYDDAKKIEKEFNIDAYPTYLFLSSDGRPLHRASGSFLVDKFLSIASDALNPETQSYTLAAKYDPTKMDISELKKVAISLRRSAPEFAGKLALNYFKKIRVNEISLQENLSLLTEFNTSPLIQEFVEEYLAKLTKGQLLDRSIIQLITSFLNSSQQRGFKLFYENSEAVDQVMNTGKEHKVFFAKNFVDYIIYKEQIEPLVSKENSKEPDWNKVFLTIQNKFNKEYADRIVIQGKKRWYGSKKNNETYCKYVVEFMEKYGFKQGMDWDWNENAWMIFKYSKDKQKLEKALSWSNRAVSVSPVANWMDTYANLLYKLGRVPQAIRWEQVAAKLDPDDKDIQTNLEKMKNRVVTWPEN